MIVSDFKSKDADAVYYGAEPIFANQPDSQNRSFVLCQSFNWYSRLCNSKNAKDFLIQYLEQTDKKELAKKLSKVEEREIMTTFGWLSRLYLRGLNLSSEETTRLSNEINRLVESISKPKLFAETSSNDNKVVESVVNNRLNIQDIMKERTREVAGEIEGWFDEFIIQGSKSTSIESVNCIGLLSDRNIMPQHIGILVDLWKRKLEEYEIVQTATDKQLNEAYGNFNKTQIKSIVKFCEAVLASLNSYVSIKKSNQAPRKKKPVTPEKLVSKLKYLKTDETLKLSSVSPTKIIGASEIWLYDTAKRKLTYVIADTHIGTLTVKGTTILGYDSTKSQTKTLRKPAETLKKFTAAGKPASRKIFTELTTVGISFNGRTNENIIILKAY